MIDPIGDPIKAIGASIDSINAPIKAIGDPIEVIGAPIEAVCDPIALNGTGLLNKLCQELFIDDFKDVT